MGKLISKYAKARAAKPAGPKGRKSAGVLPPPASEGEVPAAAPPAPIQGASSTPKMKQPGLATGLDMQAPIGK